MAGSLGNSPTTAAGRPPSGTAGPELDFRSAARMEDLTRLIQEFSKHEQREYDDQRALEIHTAKDFIFSMLGERGEGGQTPHHTCTSVKQKEHARYYLCVCACMYVHARACLSVCVYVSIATRCHAEQNIQAVHGRLERIELLSFELHHSVCLFSRFCRVITV